MRSLPKPVDDPAMRKLVTLVQEQLPYASHCARFRLLEQLAVVEQEALEAEADPGTLRSIRATQGFVRSSDPQPGWLQPDESSTASIDD